MVNRTKVHHWLWGKMVLQGKQEYCTSQKTGVLYNTEIRNIVHHWKQEFCTTQKTGILYNTKKPGILYITYMMREKHQCAHVCGKGGSTLACARTPPGSELILTLEAWCHRILLPMHADNLVEWRLRGLKEATVHQTFCNNTIPFTLLIIWAMYNIPLFSVIQKIPVFCVVQYSWFQWCTIFLISVMYNIPLFCDVQYSCFSCSIIVWCMIIWIISFLKMAWCT